MRSVILDTGIMKTLSREKLIQYVKDNAWNGRYVYKVCLKCGNYLTSPTTSVEQDLEVQKECFKCDNW